MQIVKNGIALQTIDDWRAHAPPKSADQWTRGRSAMECAAAWFGSAGPCVPAEIVALLSSHDDTARTQITSATPDYRVKFNGARGEPRSCDVVASAESDEGIVAITIEAKADERFERAVEQVLADAVDRRAHGGERTGTVARIEKLAASLLPPPRRGVPPLGGLRYQLLTAAAGALAYARELGASRAVLIVHEFVTERAEDRMQATNYADLSAFAARLSDGEHPTVEAGRLLGPLSVPGEPLFERPAALYIGKAVRRLRQPAP
jgi:hypothetical protein